MEPMKLNNKTNNMTISIQESIDNFSAIFVVVRIKDYYFNFDIDTGSSYNIIFDYVYNQFPQGFEATNKSSDIFGIDGKYNTCPTVKCNLCFDNQSYETEFQVICANDAVNNVQKDLGVQLHGVLGMQFLKDNNCVIDFANKTIKIGE